MERVAGRLRHKTKIKTKTKIIELVAGRMAVAAWLMGRCSGGAGASRCGRGRCVVSTSPVVYNGVRKVCSAG